MTTCFCPVCGAANDQQSKHCFACGHFLLLTNNGDSTGPTPEKYLRQRYELGTLLGSGGFSRVYRARDTQAGGREVAIKQILLQGLTSEETIEATDTFNREVNLLSALNHPQIPRLYDHFYDRDHWYLVEDYLEGTTLEVYLEKRAAQQRPIALDEALGMALQLCTVLEYLHTCQPPIIFRDLKPGNIIRTPGGKLCLIDFGIARRFRPGQARDTQRLGSPGYAAPEQYGRAQTTPQADIYSLGALLYALLSGQDPADQTQGLAALRLDKYAHEAELQTLIRRMLSSEPGKRPANVSAVATALKQVQAQQRVKQDSQRIWVPPTPQTYSPALAQQQHIHVHGQPPSIQGNPSAPKKRTRRRTVLVGLSTLAVALAGVSVVWETRRVAPLSSMPQAIANGPTGPSGPAPLYTYRGHTSGVWNAVWSPDGGRIASCSEDHTVQIWDALSGANAFIYSGHLDAVNDAHWSPDGKQIASASEDTTVHVWDAFNGNDLLIYTGHKGSVIEANWSPDGQKIASCSADKTVHVWHALSGELINIYTGHTQEVQAVKWSPDGKYLASASQDTTVQVWDATTAHPIFTYGGHKAAVNEVAWSPDSLTLASASNDGTAQVWDALNGDNALTYARGGQMNTVAWSPDKQFIASGGSEGTLQVWGATNATALFSYPKMSDGTIIEANWSPNGGLIATAVDDGAVYIWLTESIEE